jgi:hypothetical protein
MQALLLQLQPGIFVALPQAGLVSSATCCRLTLLHSPVVLVQMAVAVYFLDKLALRAGHEKDDDEADTVGCCTLKVSLFFFGGGWHAG